MENLATIRYHRIGKGEYRLLLFNEMSNDSYYELYMRCNIKDKPSFWTQIGYGPWHGFHGSYEQAIAWLATQPFV